MKTRQNMNKTTAPLYKTTKTKRERESEVEAFHLLISLTCAVVFRLTASLFSTVSSRLTNLSSALSMFSTRRNLLSSVVSSTSNRLKMYGSL